jgi:hypothetical protein
VLEVIGGEPAMLPLISVMVHPGRRLGTMLEATLFCMTGLLLGNAYALLGRFIAQCILGNMKGLPDNLQLTMNYDNYRAALAVLAVFQIIMLFFHGWMRVISHKFFGMVFPLFLVVHFTFTDNLNVSAGTIAKNFTVPFFLGIAISLMCNLLLFPEFGSSYLGTSMIQTLNELHETLDLTIQFFNADGNQYSTDAPSLAHIVSKKKDLRSKLNSTQAVLQECSYEISYSYLSPAQLKPLISLLATQLSYTNALINASQLEHTTLMRNRFDSKFQEAMERTKESLFKLHKNLTECLYIIKLAISRSYDVDDKLATKSSCIAHEEIDIGHVHFDTELNNLVKSLANLDLKFREEFKTLSSEFEDYLKPNDQMFILSSFLMNLKETTNSVCNMMRETEYLFQTRIQLENKGIFGRSIWISFLKSKSDMKGWFEANRGDVMNANEGVSLNGDTQTRIYLGDHRRKVFEVEHESDQNLEGADLIPECSFFDKIIAKLLSYYELHKPHIRFGLQCAIGLTLATFPMFIPEARQWFVDIRGPWIGFVCILVLEPEVGSTFFVFFLRGVGVISGAAWGYLSYVAGIHQTNPYLETVITVIGAVPGFYFFLGTPYIKAAIIGIISIYIVLLSTAIPSEAGGSILVNFGKRCLAMIYGGAVALLCQLIFFPIKARDELINEVVHSAGNISKLLLLYAAGIEGESLQMSMPEKRFDGFQKISSDTKASLIRADAYRVSAKKEPRLKGDFHDIGKIFSEIIFIMREVTDRLDNIVQLRRAYGSAIIEEFNSEAFPYRRQLIASMNNSLKAVELALSTKSPLPQYLPSPSIAHKRMIQKGTELIQDKYQARGSLDGFSSDSDSDSEDVMMLNVHKRRINRVAERQQESILKEKFLSWNASSAATEEIIQYIEELLDLTKVLVGVNEFKYGFLSRSLYSDYAAKAARGYRKAMNTTPNIDDELEDDDENDLLGEEDLLPVAFAVGDGEESIRTHSGISDGFRRRVYSIGSWIRGDGNHSVTSLGHYYDDSSLDDSEQLPLSLMRVVSRKAESTKAEK